MRRPTDAPARRAGMTLIELLVVMIIIATLASLVIGAVFNVREAQMKNFTETLINKLISAMDQQMKAAVDQIRDEPVPAVFVTLAGGDPLRAKVIYLKARLVQEFPVTFDQARRPFPQSPTADYLPGKPAYRNLPATPTNPTAAEAAAESSARYCS